MKIYDSTVFDWFNYIAQNYNSNALIQFVLKTDDNFNFDILKRAMTCCIIADPLLGCTFLQKDDMPQWIEANPDVSDLCKYIQTENPDYEINNCLAENLDASRQCPVVIYLIESQNDKHLVVKTHHALCDAAGALQFVRLLAEMYSEVENDTDFEPESVIPRRGTEDFYKYFGIKDKRSSFNPSLLSPMQGSWGTPSYDFYDSQSFAYRTMRFSEDEFLHIREFAKINNSSINATLTAAYHRALCMLIKPSETLKEIQFSANLRNYVDEYNNTICNLSNLFNVQLPVQVSFAELARQAKENIDKVIAPEVVLQSVLACELMSTHFETLDSYYQSDWENVKQTGICTPMISNIGRMDSKPIKFGESEVLDMYLVSPAFVSPSFMLAVSTYRNIMTFCVSYQKPSMNDDFVQSLLDTMRTILVK